MTEFESKCYGMSEVQIREEYMNSITAKFSGLEMVAMGVLSDSQELMAMGRTEQARKQINIAKFIPYAFLGMFTLETAKANLVLAPFALLGAWIGVRAPLCAGTRIFRPDLCAADRNRGQARLGGADLISGVISLGRKGLNHLLKRLARRDKACNP